MFLEVYFGTVFSPTRLRSRSPKSILLYEISLRHFARSLGRRPTLDDLNDATVGLHLTRLRKEGRAAATVNRERTNLVAIWNHAAKRRLVAEFPDVEKEIEPKRVPRAWTLEEARRIYRQAQAEKGTIGGVPASEWWSGLILVLWDTGERIGAVMAIERSDVSVSGLSLTCRAETRKGGREDRFYRLTPRTIAALQKLIGYGGRAVFPWPYCESYLWKKYRALLVRAGLPSDRGCLFHRVRRSVASYVQAAGGDATEALGHSDSRVTKRYLDPQITGEASPLDFLPDLGVDD